MNQKHYVCSTMIEIETKKATEDLRKLGNELSQRQIAKAIVRALNYAVQRVNTQAGREVRKLYNIKASELSKQTKPISANANNLTAALAAQFGTMSLNAFGAKSIQTSSGVKQKISKKKHGFASSKIKRGAQGVYVEILKGHEQYIPSAFMGFWNKKGSASGGAIFARGEYGSGGFEFAKGRAPITKLKTKSMYYMILNPDTAKPLTERGIDTYEKRLIHELTKGIQYGGAK
jgi:hypothetical protein